MPDLSAKPDVRALTRDFALQHWQAHHRLPSATEVYAQLRYGSLSTITSELKAVRQELADQQQREAALPGLSPAFAQYAAPFLQGLWTDAYRRAAADFAPQRDAWQQEREQLQAQLTAATAELHAAAEQRAELVDALQHAQALAEAKEQAVALLANEQQHLRDQQQRERAAAAHDRQEQAQQHARAREELEQQLRQLRTTCALAADELQAERERHAGELASAAGAHQTAQRELQLQLDLLRQKTLQQATELARLREQQAHAGDELAQQQAALATSQARLEASEVEAAGLRAELAGTRSLHLATRQLFDELLARWPSEPAASGAATSPPPGGARPA